MSELAGAAPAFQSKRSRRAIPLLGMGCGWNKRADVLAVKDRNTWLGSVGRLDVVKPFSEHDRTITGDVHNFECVGIGNIENCAPMFSTMASTPVDRGRRPRSWPAR
jgi:hypothetical protein